MLRNYLKIVWRNLSRQPLYALLNLSCLVIGIAAALAILLYLDFELNFDRFHEKADRIYHIETKAIKTHDKTIDVDWPSTPPRLAGYMKQDYPEVVSYTRIYQFFINENVGLEFDGKTIEEANVRVADPSVLEVFSFNFLHGEQNTALSDPNKVILSASLSKRIFGEVNPVGKLINTELFHMLPDADPNYTFIVEGVYEDFPENSSIEMDMIISAASDPRSEDYHFGRFTFNTFVILQPGNDPDIFAAKLSDIYEKYIDPEREPTLKAAVHELVPLTQVHMNETGGFSYIYIFAAIGLLMLLIAIISYINLATAQGSKRAMEIGVRKVMGSSRQQLAGQFLSESFFFSLLAFLLAVSIITSVTPVLNTLLNLQLDAHNLLQPHLVISMVALLLLIGFLGGSYPAFFLSSFRPIAVLKGKIAKGSNMRRGLVAIQFAVVIFVLISTAMIYEQLRFMSNKDLGFDNERVIRISLDAEEKVQKTPTLREAFVKSPNIQLVGSTSFIPGVWMGRRPLSADNAPSRESQFVYFGNIDYDYLEAMGIPIIKGRNYSEEHAADATENILVNESLVRNFGLKNPIGEKVRYGDQNNPNFVRIVGVVQDHHQNSLHTEIGSQIFLLNPNRSHLMVKIDQNVAEGIAHIEKSWNEIFPNEPLTYNFLDEDLARSYEIDQTRGKLFLLFSGITIFIAFLGLFGLASFMVQRRVKEIGIRRVLGASITNIVSLISKDFLLLVTLAALPAFILARYFIHQWLEDFAYHVNINYFLFFVVLFGILLITLVITGFHALRATLINPSQTLKYE